MRAIVDLRFPSNPSEKESSDFRSMDPLASFYGSLTERSIQVFIWMFQDMDMAEK